MSEVCVLITTHDYNTCSGVLWATLVNTQTDRRSIFERLAYML